MTFFNLECKLQLVICNIIIKRGSGMRFFYAVFFCLYFLKGFSQTPSQSYLNSLEYEQLLGLFDKYDNDSLSLEKIARTYLERARKEGDTLKIARAYDRLARAFSPKTNLKYADSLIEYTKGWDHIYFSSLGYILKGFEYSRIDDVRNTIDNYLIADSISEQNKNLDAKVYILDRLVYVFLSLDNPKKALEYQKKRHNLIFQDNYFESLLLTSRKEEKVNVDLLYQERKIQSFENYVACYLHINKLDSASYYLVQIEEQLKNYNGFFKDSFFRWYLDAKMEIEYLSGNYRTSIKIADSIFKIIDLKNNLYNYKNLNLFKGLSYLNINEIENAEKYLLIADSIYNENQTISLIYYDRFLFNGLFVVNKKKNKLEKQIVYLNKQLYLDSLIRVRSQYFFPKMNYKFETPNLLKEKEQLINALKNTNQKSHTLFYFSLLTIGIASIIAAFFYRRQRLYKKRFLSLLAIHDQDKNPNAFERNALEGISSEIIQDIQSKLKTFELKKAYLKNDITLQNLAKTFETNANYLSRVLNSTKQKNFSQYLNELRINFAVEAIRYNPEFKKYTIDAIAKECGYNSGTSFSRVFYKQTGIYPSYYIENLSKIIPEVAKP